MNSLLHEHTQHHLAAITPGQSASYLFHGPRAVGKATAALELTRRLNCAGDATGLCAPCRQLAAGNYPDFLLVRPEEKPSITIEQIRVLIKTLGLSPYRAAGTRVVLIDGADLMTTEAQNALLKLIEEPPARTIFVLVAAQSAAVLPTVRSRCVAVYFPPLAAGAIARLLTAAHGVPGPRAAELAAVADGAPGLAVELAAHPEAAEARLQFRRLAASAPQLPRFERLLLATRLTATKTDLERFGHALHATVIEALRTGAVDPPAALRRLAALERFRAQLAANVAPRVATECLMLEL